jgi:hypothetical protein
MEEGADLKSYSFQAQIQKHDGMWAETRTKRMEQEITRLSDSSE